MELGIPSLKKVQNGFEGKTRLNTWSGFQLETSSIGECDLSVGGDMLNTNSIEDYHIKAFNYAFENQKLIKTNILNELYKEYKNIQELYDIADPIDKQKYTPDISSVEDFKKLIQINAIDLINQEKDGFGYVGYSFWCKWDEEHALGIMTHKNRIVEIGGAETSFLTWIASKDKNENVL
jgi:hypothetical protein